MRRLQLFIVAVGWALVAGSLWGQAPSVPAAGTERRVSLVIGNDQYQTVPKLERAVADARAMGAELRRMGFEVMQYANLDRRRMNQAVGELVEKVSGGGVGILFYAGHGVQVSGSNFLLPVDVQLSRADDLADEAIDMGRVMERLSTAKAKFTLMIIDACRDNPFPRVAGRSIGGSRGLTIPSAPDGLMVVYSAGVNEQALDKLSDVDRDPNGLFTREFIKQLREPGVRVDDMVRRVRSSVREQAARVGHSQNPAIYDQSNGDFYFTGAGTQTASLSSQSGNAPAAFDPTVNDRAFWDSVKDSKNPEELKAYIDNYPSGLFVALAQTRLKAAQSVQIASAVPSVAATRTTFAIESIATLAAGTGFRDCADCPDMVVMSPGEFIMGTDNFRSMGVVAKEIDATPAHKVTIAKPFAIGKYEVTVGEWQACVADRQCFATDVSATRRHIESYGGQNAMSRLTWDDAKQFVAWLSKKSGRNYRLPSEAEWEYAARSGSRDDFPWGTSDRNICQYARVDNGNFMFSNYYCGDEDAQRFMVGTRAPNKAGLFDMIGNVSEWVEDCAIPGYRDAPTDGSARSNGSCKERILRGGSGNSSSPTVWYRENVTADFANWTEQGLRVVRD